MTAKEYLRSLIDLNNEVDALCEQIDWLRTQAHNINVHYSDMPSGGNGSDLAEIVADMLEAREAYAAAVDTYVNRKREAMTLIRKIKDAKYRIILIKRYINGDSWGKIAEDLSYSERQLFRYHGQALRLFGDQMKGVSKCQLNL